MGELVRYKVGKEHVLHHLKSNEGWANKQFDEVDQDRLHIAMDEKPYEYKVWLLSKNTLDTVAHEFRLDTIQATSMETWVNVVRKGQQLTCVFFPTKIDHNYLQKE